MEQPLRGRPRRGQMENIMSNFNLVDLSVRLAYNLATAFVIIRLIYFPRDKKREFLFTFFVFNLLIFFVCSFLKYIIMDIGFAFGLFAVFTILRYRTETIPIREMTYQFLVITLGAVNGLANAGTWHPELAFINLVILVMVFILDSNALMSEEYSQIIKYEKIELIKPTHRPQLLTDLRDRTGLNILRLNIRKIDFLRDTAEIVVYYR